MEKYTKNAPKSIKNLKISKLSKLVQSDLFVNKLYKRIIKRNMIFKIWETSKIEQKLRKNTPNLKNLKNDPK